MSFIRQGEKILATSAVLAVMLAAVAFAADQHDKKSSPPPAPKPAPHVSAPAPRPSTNRPSTTNHPPTTHTPTTGNTRTTTTGTRPGTTTGKTGVGAAGKTGNNTAGRPGTVGGNNRGVAGKTGPGSAMGRNNTNMAKGRPGAPTRTFNRPPPGRQVSLRGGGTASIRPNGKIRSINRNGMHIDRGLNGSRRIESTHNGARIVTTGRNSGYVQRAYVTRNGRTYVSRTVIINHRAYTGVYRSYSYRGRCCYYGYHPAYYYHPVYYGWAYNPWPAPVYYGWGWGGTPWYGYYGGYFAPYPTYPSAAFWLTDYLIAANLQAAYQAQAAANAAAADNAAAQQSQSGGDTSAPASGSGAVALSPEVKQAIAEEVKAQLAAEQAAAAPQASSGGQQSSQQSSQQPSQANAGDGEVPPALDPARRTFVVSSDLTVNADGEECQLTQGDVITRITDTPDDDNKVNVSVSASKKNDCAAGKQVAVSVDDLQEMQNHFQEQIDAGMKDLAAKQGTSGLPKAPDTATVASDVPPPPPDTSAEKALEEQQASADQVESQVVKEAFSQGS